MKYLTLFIFLFITNLSFSQVIINGVDINELPDLEYIQIVGYDKGFFKKKIIINLDYGQEYKPFNAPVISNKENKRIHFNSMVGALNYLTLNGWEYVNSYTVTLSDSSVYHYLLKRSE